MRYAAVCVAILSLAGPSWSAGPPAVRRDALGDPLPHHALFRLGSNRLRAPGLVSAVALSPDGRVAAATGMFPALYLWDLPSGRLRARLDDVAGRHMNNPIFSPDGKLVAATSNIGDSPHNGFCIWDVALGKLHSAGSVPGQDMASWAFSPDSKLLAGSRPNQGLMLFDAATGRKLRSIDATQVIGRRITFSPCGTLLAAPMRDATVALVRVATGKIEQTIFGEKGRIVLDLTFSPDGHRLATLLQRGGIRVWDLHTGKQERSLNLETQEAGCRIQFTEGGRELVVLDSKRALIRLDAQSGKELSRWAKLRERFGASISIPADGKNPVLLGEWGSCELRLVDLRRGREVGPPIAGHPGPVSFLAVSPDGRHLAAGCASGWSPVIHLWDLTTGKPVRELAGHTGELASLVWSPDGKRLASSSSQDQSIRLWDPQTGRCLNTAALGGLYGPILAIGASGKHLVVSGWKNVKGTSVGLLGVWDFPSMKQRRLIETFCISRGLTFPDDVTLASLEEGHLRFRDVATLELTRPAVLANLQDWRTATSADASRRAGVDLGLKLCVLEGETGIELSRLRPVPLTAMFALSADGELLALTTEAGLIELFDATSGARLAEFRHPAAELDWALVFTPDGERLVSGGNDSTVLVWDVRAALRGRVAAIKPLDATKCREHWSSLGSRNPAAVRGALLALRDDPWGMLQLAEAEFKADQPKAVTEQMRRLIAELDAESFPVRERANRALAAIGEPARQALKQAAEKDGSVEVKRRVATLLRLLGAEGLTEGQLRALRAVRLLERIGGQATRRVLERLAKGSIHDPVTRAAAASLRRRTSQEHLRKQNVPFRSTKFSSGR